MSTVAERLRSPKEKALHIAALVVGTLLWLIIAFWGWSALHNPDPRIAAISGVYIFYALAIGVFVFLSSVFYRAAAFGNMILLGPDQFPALHAMVVSAPPRWDFPVRRRPSCTTPTACSTPWPAGSWAAGSSS